MNETTTIKLRKPITAHGEDIQELKLREPTGEDIEKCGYPLAIGEGKAYPIAESVSKLIARLAAIPPSSVKQLAVADYQAAMGVVLGFFGSGETDAD